jgi:acetyl esterase
VPIPLRTAAFWTLYSLVDRAPVMQQSAAKVRAASNARRRLMALPAARLLTGRTHRGAAVSGEHAVAADGTALPLRIHRPRDAAGERLPVVLNFHGGGWVSGDVHQSEWWASSLAVEARVAVVSVEYRLAPEHPFPGPPEDCYDATVWVSENAGELAVDADRLAVMGDSAGGNLAAAVCLMARDRGTPAIAAQVLVYPSVELVEALPSESENVNVPILTSKDIANTPRLYFHNSTGDRSDPYASPLRAKHEGLPPALIQTAQFDPLRDHGPAYAQALRVAGVPVRLTNYVDAVHGYLSLPGLVPVARQALAETAAFVREQLAG